MVIIRQKDAELMPLLIEDISNNLTGIFFHGVVSVTYLTFLDKTNKSKAILHAKLTDKKAKLRITLLVPTLLIEQHESNLIANVGVSIKDFKIIPKHKYDCGDCEKTICLNSLSSVENICHICAEYRFFPNTTIANLSHKEKCLSHGHNVAIAISITQTTTKYVLEIKRNNGEHDKAIIRFVLFKSFIVTKFIEIKNKLRIHRSLYFNARGKIIHCLLYDFHVLFYKCCTCNRFKYMINLF